MTDETKFYKLPDGQEVVASSEMNDSWKILLDFTKYDGY